MFFPMWILIFFVSLLHAQTSPKVAVARASYLSGFSQNTIEGISQRCFLADDWALRFCREGYFASKALTENPEKYIFAVGTAEAFNSYLEREAVLGYGIGAGEHFDLLSYKVPKKMSQYDGAVGLRSFFLDGVGTGIFLHFRGDLASAVRFCRGFDADADRIACLFGVGRATVFSNFPQNLSSSDFTPAESYHLIQGANFAKVYAGQELETVSSGFSPGSLAGVGILYRALYAENPTVQLQRRCTGLFLSHHYFCALQILNPEALYVWRN